MYLCLVIENGDAYWPLLSVMVCQQLSLVTVMDVGCDVEFRTNSMLVPDPILYIHFTNASIAILELNRCGLQWSTMLWLRWNCHWAHARSLCATSWLPR
jgi:hypothetical protein